VVDAQRANAAGVGRLYDESPLTALAASTTLTATGTLTIGSGAGSPTIGVPLARDGTAEGPESFQVFLHSSGPFTNLCSPSQFNGHDRQRTAAADPRATTATRPPRPVHPLCDHVDRAQLADRSRQGERAVAAARERERRWPPRDQSRRRRALSTASSPRPRPSCA
jgi:hypothetical protein